MFNHVAEHVPPVPIAVHNLRRQGRIMQQLLYRRIVALQMVSAEIAPGLMSHFVTSLCLEIADSAATVPFAVQLAEIVPHSPSADLSETNPRRPQYVICGSGSQEISITQLLNAK